MVKEDMFFEAIEKDELILLLRGDEPYRIESSQYAPDAGTTDVGKVLSRIIYKAYKMQPDIKEEVEKAFLEMLEQTDFDVYMVILYIASQLFKENNNLSPFKLDMTLILPKIRMEIMKRKEKLQQGIIYPDGMKNDHVWDEIERLNCVMQEEYNVYII